MAFNVGISSKEAFSQLKKLTPRQRVDFVKNYNQGPATILSMLTPAEFAELFPKYTQKGLPDVSGFREAISRKSNQKQDDINFGLSQGAQTVEQAEQYGQWRRRLGGGKEDPGRTTSTTGSTRASGSLAANQREAYKAAIAEGLSPTAAKILVANMSGESLKNPSDHHWDRSHMSQGIVQWDPSRAERIKDKFGAYPKDMSVAQQTKAAIWEMKTYYGKSYAALTNESLDPQQRLHTVVADYERPQDVSGSVATRMGYLKGMSADIGGGGGSSTGGSAPDFSQYALHKGVNNYQGQCGIGTRQLAGRMFGNSYFDKGLGEGGDFHAGSLSSGNKYFQSSGFYASGKPMGKDALSQDYLNSLPIGTVVSSQGGSRGGHVQIKIGPNQWASDTVQSGFYYGNGYDNFVVHQPNEAGLAALAKNGVVQPGEAPGLGPKMAQEGVAASVTAQQTVAPAAPAPRQPDLPPEVPDNGQTATVSKPGKQEAAAKTFNVNRQALIGAIKQTDEFKNTFGSSLASDEMIYSGFFDDARTKKLMADTQSSFDPNTGTVKIGNYEAFKKSVGMDTSKILTEVADNVPSHAGGGRERVKGPLHMRHLHHQRRGDTALVTDARGKQFTVNPKKETMSVNPQTGIMDIKPVKSGDQMDIEKLMAIIRKQESGSFEGNYNADLAAKKHKKGQRHDTASGAYQFNNRTWQGVLNKELNMPHILKQYPRAVNAPKEVQDQVMKARIEKWRAAGHSDNEIILHHFTGNKEGKLSAAAQKGNPTPAQYRAQIASHATDYDRTYQPQPQAQPAKTDVAKAGPITTQPAPQTESMASKLASPLKSLLDPGAVAAAEAVKAAPAPEAPKGSVEFAPPDMQQPPPTQTQLPTQLPPDRPASPIVMNPAETRPAHMQPTPSLARAMDNARGVTDSGYTGLTGTKLGGK